MFWKYIKVLFSDKEEKPIPKEVEEETIFLSEGNVKNGGVNPPPLNPKPSIPPKPLSKPKPLNKPKNHAIIEEVKQQKEQTMPGIYLVVLDATGRTNFKALTQQLHNFYFIYANDETSAKDIVISTFHNRGRASTQLMNELYACIKATELNIVLRNMSPQHNFWTYVQMGKSRHAGQQVVPPNPNRQFASPTDPNDPEATSARAYVHQAPVGGQEITPEDLRNVQFSGQDGSVVNKLRNPSGGPVAPLPEEAPPLAPEQELINQLLSQNKQMADQNKEMMDKMSAILAAQSAPAPTRRAKAKAQAPSVPTGPAAPTE